MAKVLEVLQNAIKAAGARQAAQHAAEEDRFAKEAQTLERYVRQRAGAILFLSDNVVAALESVTSPSNEGHPRVDLRLAVNDMGWTVWVGCDFANGSGTLDIRVDGPGAGDLPGLRTTRFYDEAAVGKFLLAWQERGISGWRDPNEVSADSFALQA